MDFDKSLVGLGMLSEGLGGCRKSVDYSALAVGRDEKLIRS